MMIGSKEIAVKEILRTIIYLPATEVRSFFHEIGLTIPRELRIHVLRELLRDRVIETRKTRLTMADELNYRLSWFTEFSETQLENLLTFYDDPELDKTFLEEFWVDLFQYMLDKGVPEKDFVRLIDMSVEHVKKHGLKAFNVRTYNREIKDLFYDSHGRIDGLSQAKIRPVLYKSSTLSEIRDLGEKYDVNVPRRLKKSELADIIINELKNRNLHTDALEEEIRGMSVLVLQRYAIDNDIKASTELKKEEIIEYILANAKETKEAYFVPDSPTVYEKEVSEISEEPVEEIPVKEEEPVVEEVVVEEVKDEVAVEQVETKVVEEPKTIVQSNINLDELVVEVRKLREAVESFGFEEDEEIYDFDDVEFDDEDLELTEEEPIIVNTAEFIGTKKDYKKFKKAEIKVINDQEKMAQTEEEILGNHPVETRALAKFFILIGKFLWAVLKVLLKVVLYLAIFAIIIFIIYGVLTFFVSIEFLEGFNSTINGFEIAGKGILQHFHDFLSSLGLTKAQ